LSAASVDRQAGRLVWLSCIVQFIDVVGVTMLVIALPAIDQELRLGAAMLSWVAATYALAFGGLLVLGGRAVGAVEPVRCRWTCRARCW
jgi:MFS family permease